MWLFLARLGLFQIPRDRLLLSFLFLHSVTTVRFSISYFVHWLFKRVAMSIRHLWLCSMLLAIIWYSRFFAHGWKWACLWRPLDSTGRQHNTGRQTFCWQDQLSAKTQPSTEPTRGIGRFNTYTPTSLLRMRVIHTLSVNTFINNQIKLPWCLMYVIHAYIVDMSEVWTYNVLHLWNIQLTSDSESPS